MNFYHKNISCLLCLLLFLSLFTTRAQAQEAAKALDVKAIKSMVGCYDIEFKYTETFSPEVDYEPAYDYTSAAFEWAELVEESDDKIVIQHLLIIPDSASSYNIKHWRQDRVYEADYAFRYDKNNRWIFSPQMIYREKRNGFFTGLRIGATRHAKSPRDARRGSACLAQGAQIGP